VHVAIIGAGALGCVYGGKLAQAGAGVTLVVRPGREGDTRPVRLQRVDTNEEYTWAAPTRAASVPLAADVVMVCVRNEQLDDGLVTELCKSPGAPVVVMTPMLPADFSRMSAAMPGRVVPAMPGVVAYATPEGVFRYWLPHAAQTLVEETRPMSPAVTELVATLAKAGVASRTEADVHELNPATTVSFLPLALALDVAGSADALLDDSQLVHLALRATDEGRDLARAIGRTAAWSGLLLKFVSPMTLKIGIGIARRTSAEAVAYVEGHFGRKLHVQNVVMSEKIVRLAEEKGTPRIALEELHARLSQVAG
jgi:ketopantoate reductase